MYHHGAPLTYYSLRAQDHALLASDQQIVIDRESELISLIDWRAQQILKVATIFDDEIDVLEPLFQAWPKMVPYEKLIQLVSQPQERVQCARILNQAFINEDEEKIERCLNMLLLPLRTRMRECLNRLYRLGLTVGAIHHHGLILMAADEGIKAK